MKKVIILLCLLSSAYVNAAIVYVNKTATGANNGTSWANAYTDLETALLFAVSGDQIWVAKGTYLTSSANDRTSSFILNNGVNLYGNFYGNETNINQRTGLIPNSIGSDRTNETILSGDIGIQNDSTDNANHVMYIINNVLPIIIDGVKVTKGNAIMTTGKGKGAGIYIENTGSVTLRNVIVMNNTATPGLDGKGAGIYVNNATSFVLENATVVRNRMIDDPLVSGSAYYYGGGIFLNCPQNQITNAFLDNNKVVSNRSEINGGAVYIENSLSLNISATSIKNNLISSTNTSTGKYLRGAGIVCYGLAASVSNLTLTDISQNTISNARGNSYGAGSYFECDTIRVTDGINDDNQLISTNKTVALTNQGGGMNAWAQKRAFFTNSTFNGNTMTARSATGGGLYLVTAAGDTCGITNCRFTDNSIESSNVLDGTVIGGGIYVTCKIKILNSIISRNSVSISSYITSNSTATTTAYGGGIAALGYTGILNCRIDSNYLESSSVFDYYTMSNPNITARAYGGGIYSTSKIELLNSSVCGNNALTSIMATQLWTEYFKGSCYGGGIYNDLTTAGLKGLISNCTVNYNTAKTYISLANGGAHGGGVYAKNMDIIKNQISNNETYADLAITGGYSQGGGIYHVGTGKLYYNTISFNQANASTGFMSGGYTSHSYGGGVFSNSTDSVSNCLIHNNSVTARNNSKGGGVCNRNTSKISNVTVARNHSYSVTGTRYGSGIFTNKAGAQIQNSIIYFNDLLSYYDSTTISLVNNSVIQLYQSGGGNFNINPQFVDTLANDFHVTSGSIAINRGDSTYVPKNVFYDLEGNDRISGNNIDMGAFELDLCKNSSAIFYTICSGDSYFFNGQMLTIPGIYKDTLTNHAGCDSTVTLNLTVGSTDAVTDIKTACDSYTWVNGTTYTANNNTATHTLTNAAGCDSVVTLNLTINHSNSFTDVVTACDSYTWINGTTYTASNNTATHTLTNAAGCDSVVTLNLTINHSNASTDVVTACDSYTWINGTTYTTSNNTATHTLTNAAGCDSIVSLNLTINHSNAFTDVVTACDSYTWINGTTYTASNNTATHTLTNASGCDSVVTLNLTINHSNAFTDVVTACDSYTWINGTTYTASNNTATHTLTNAAGCDSVVTLNLTINHSNASTDVVTACDSYTWINGTTYTASNNTATHTLTNAAGCDSLLTLNLTINHSNAFTDVVTACDSYTWINGITYTASNNTATHTLTNAAGCDSVVTLNLTINHSNAFTDVVTACDSYTWINGTTYTASNSSATHTLTNASGCDSIVSLNLTINHSNAFTDVVTACDSYTWINGTTYTASNNTATHTLTNTAGCDSVVTLNLTIATVDVSVTIDGITLTAGASGATYQWTDCNDFYAPIIGETNQSYTAAANGDYAVIVTEGACIDTSICVPVYTVGIDDMQPEIQLNISPNPNNGQFSIEMNYAAQIEIMDALGKLIYTGQHNQGKAEISLGNIADGVYFVRATSTTQIKTHIIVVEK